ncbi:MAG: hypothetical protein AB7G47_21150 [Mycolicibacterium sp.]|uniref:hypothetical protein n=1 Tax=Mycolicibacterium sp. TaxID=2320850 RepID=UPI003D0CB2EB
MPDESRIEPEVIPESGDAVAPGVAHSPADPLDAGYTADGIPTFESVREKIETRYATSIGSAELAGETPEGRSVTEQYEARQEAAAERLAQIRESISSERAAQ